MADAMKKDQELQSVQEENEPRGYEITQRPELHETKQLDSFGYFN